MPTADSSDRSSSSHPAGKKPHLTNSWERLRPFYLSKTSQGWQVRIYWSRLLLSAFLALVLGYSGLVTAAYLFVKYNRGFSDAQYADLYWPGRWEAYRLARGNHYIQEGKKHLAAAEWRAGFLNLYVGLQKNPGHSEGRLLLAHFYLSLRRPDQAEKILLEGLPYHRVNADYLKTVMQFLLQQQEDTRVIAVAGEVLLEKGPISERQKIAAVASATAFFYRGDYDRAEDFLKKYILGDVRDARLLAAQIEWERGYQALALLRLQQLREEQPKDGDIAGQLASYLRELGRHSEARQVGIIRQLDNPNDARARIELLYAYSHEGDMERITPATEEFLRDFPRDAAALTSLAQFAADRGDAALARRLYDHCRSHELPWEGAALMVVDSQVVAKDYAGALESARQLLKDNPDWGRRSYALFNGLQAIAYYGLGDRETARLFLMNFFGQTTLRSENLTTLARRLTAAGARAEARDVLVQATGADPLNQAALSRLIQFDLEDGRFGEVAARIPKLLAMRKPSAELLRSAYQALASDTLLFQPDRATVLGAIRTALAGKNLAAVLRAD